MLQQLRPQPPYKRQRVSYDQEPCCSTSNDVAVVPVKTLSNDCMEAGKGFKNLPNEMLLKVFSYLSVRDLILHIPNVCTSWNILHNDPSLYVHLTFDSTFPDTLGAVNLIKMSPWLKCLKLKDRNDANEILLQVSKVSKQLKTLILFDCHGSSTRKSLSAVNMRYILTKCDTIEHLKLRGTSCYRHSFYDSIGIHLSQLKILRLEANRFLGSDTFSSIANNCNQLEELRVFHNINYERYSRTSDEIIDKICENLKGTLKVLKLNGIWWTDRAMESISKCEHLKKLHIHNAKQITNTGILKIVNLHNLINLNISRCNLVTTEMWRHLFSQPSLKNLTHMSLRVCDNLNDEVIDALALNLTSLQEVWTVGCGISDAGHLKLLMMMPLSCNLAC